jgi:LPXTG-motif cell wall-anchored protein
VQNFDSTLFVVTPGPSVPLPIPAGTKLHASVVAPITLNGNGVVADGLAINSKGDLFVYIQSDPNYRKYNNSTAQLALVDKSTGEAQLIGAPIGDTSNPAAIAGAAFDMDDHLWAFDVIDDELMKINPDGTIDSIIKLQGLPAHNPRIEHGDIAFDIDNNAYLVLGSVVYVLNMTTGNANPINTLSSSLINHWDPLNPASSPPNPNGIAFYRNGEAWIAQPTAIDNIVYSADINAAPLAAHVVVEELSADVFGSLTGGDSGSMDLAAWPMRTQTAVPANNPVALIGLALGMVGVGGFMLRRRRKQAR